VNDTFEAVAYRLIVSAGKVTGESPNHLRAAEVGDNAVCRLNLGYNEQCHKEDDIHIGTHTFYLRDALYNLVVSFSRSRTGNTYS